LPYPFWTPILAGRLAAAALALERLPTISALTRSPPCN
jgi:hypothetical protein